MPKKSKGNKGQASETSIESGEENTTLDAANFNSRRRNRSDKSEANDSDGEEDKAGFPAFDGDVRPSKKQKTAPDSTNSLAHGSDKNNTPVPSQP